jgi:citrate synthase
MQRLKSIVARQLKIDEVLVTSDLSYQSISEWDSLAHIGLIITLEKEYGLKINQEQVLKLTSIQSISDFLTNSATNTLPSEKKDKIHRGLSGVKFDYSEITMIDGLRGRLSYRGYSIHEIVDKISLEETIYLLMFGDLPDGIALAELKRQLTEFRILPKDISTLLRAMGEVPSHQALRTAVSMAEAYDPEAKDKSEEAIYRKGLRLISQIPLMVATHQAAREGRDIELPDPGVSHAAYCLALFSPKLAQAPEIVRIFEKDLILHADHSSNASTFVARIATSVEADFYGAITAAISTFAGALHGGAVEDVMLMLEEIGSPTAAKEYIAEKIAANKPIPGFGHRVYRTADPRARHLRASAWNLAKRFERERYLALMDAVVEEMKPMSRLGLDVNVDFYAAVAYRILGFSPDLYAPIFMMARIVGWTAHILEQGSKNVLIRPLLEYTGPSERRLKPARL